MGINNVYQVTAQMSMTPEEQTAFWTEIEAWVYAYFNWFGTSNWVAGATQGAFGSGYTMGDVLTVLYVEQPEEAATVTFTEYPPKGWAGWCTVADCAGQTPTGISLGYAYDAQYYYFVYYATSDAIDQGTQDAVPDVKAWGETNFPWTVEVETSAPDSSGVAAILSAIGADPSPLTVTLIWDAPVDLDLYFYCDDGSQINYQTPSASGSCGGKLDSDMTASNYGNDRGDGVQGQIENISVGVPVEGHEYNGKVQYYGGSGNAPFMVVFSGTDSQGTLHVYGSQSVDTMEGSGTEVAYHFTYTA